MKRKEKLIIIFSSHILFLFFFVFFFFFYCLKKKNENDICLCNCLIWKLRKTKKMIKQAILSCIENMYDLHANTLNFSFFSSRSHLRKKKKLSIRIYTRNVFLSVKVAATCWIFEILLFFKVFSFKVKNFLDVYTYTHTHIHIDSIHNDDQSTFNQTTTTTTKTTTTNAFKARLYSKLRFIIDSSIFLLFHPRVIKWMFKNKYCFLFIENNRMSMTQLNHLLLLDECIYTSRKRERELSIQGCTQYKNLEHLLELVHCGVKSDITSSIFFQNRTFSGFFVFVLFSCRRWNTQSFFFSSQLLFKYTFAKK